MNVHAITGETERRTTADDVFARLHAEIVSLRLAPGTKLSEAEVAKQSAVSRQPVREAFIRLNDMNLLQIRPQKATLVRKISMSEILNTRFIRTAVEVEVVRRACANADASDFEKIEGNLKAQKRAAGKRDTNGFHELDYAFHHLLCSAARAEFAFQTIADNKSHVDRLCMISLASKDGMLQLHQDHRNIFEALKKRDKKSIESLTRLHLTRLDETLAAGRDKYPDYFED